MKLEQRVRELEDPEYVSPAVTLSTPHIHSRSNSSSSSFGSPESSYLSASLSPFPQSGMWCDLSLARPWLTTHVESSPASPPGSWVGLQVCPVLLRSTTVRAIYIGFSQGISSPSPTPFLNNSFFDDHHSKFQPPLELTQML